MVRPWLNYHHLLYFKSIAMEGGVAGAAKKLRLGQPTLSTQLKQFEDALGQQLFDRSKRQLQLTEVGRLVLGYANEIFRLGDELLDAVSDHHTTSKIQVQIGATDMVSKHLTALLFNQAQSYGECVVSLTEGHTDELLRELRAHKLDLVLSTDPPPIGESGGFIAKSIAKMPVAIFGHSKFKHLRKDFPASISGQPFIMPSLKSKLRSDIDHFLKLNSIVPLVRGEVQDTSLQKVLAIHGEGLLPTPEPAAEELLRNKQLIEIGVLPDVYEELWLIAAHRRLQNPVGQRLLKEFTITHT